MRHTYEEDTRENTGHAGTQEVAPSTVLFVNVGHGAQLPSTPSPVLLNVPGKQGADTVATKP